jgi:hypothetical protein
MRTGLFKELEERRVCRRSSGGGKTGKGSHDEAGCAKTYRMHRVSPGRMNHEESTIEGDCEGN